MFFIFYFYYYSIKVVPIFLLLLFPTPPTPPSHIHSSPHSCLCPWIPYTCSLTTLPFFVPLPLSPLPSGFFLSLSSVYRASLNISFRTDFLAPNYLSFSLSKNVFILLSFLKETVFTWYKIVSWQVFCCCFFPDLKTMLLHFIVVTMVLMK